MKKKANVLAWVEKAEQDFEGAVFLAGKRSKSVPDLVCFHSQQDRYPGEKSSTAYAKHALKAIKEVRKFFALHLEALVPAGERSRTVNEALAKELLSIRRRKLTERLRTLRKKGPAVATEDIVAALRKDRESH